MGGFAACRFHAVIYHQPSPLAYTPKPKPPPPPTDLAFFDVNKTGELAGRLSTDVHEVAEHLVEVCLAV